MERRRSVRRSRTVAARATRTATSPPRNASTAARIRALRPETCACCPGLRARAWTSFRSGELYYFLRRTRVAHKNIPLMLGICSYWTEYTNIRIRSRKIMYLYAQNVQKNDDKSLPAICLMAYVEFAITYNPRSAIFSD